MVCSFCSGSMPRAWSRVDGGRGRLLLEIVSALDGLPLALEMIASRLRLFTIEQIHRRLKERFKLLQDRHREGRHNSIYNAIEWSWSLLSDAEQSADAVIVLSRWISLNDAEAIVDISDFKMPFCDGCH